MCTHVRQNFWKVSSNSEQFKKNRVFCGFRGNGAILKILLKRWISIRNIIIYLETKFRPNRRIFVLWRPLRVQNHQGHHSKPKWSPYGAAYLTPCKYPFPLKSVYIWIFNDFLKKIILVAIWKILKSKSTTLSDDLFLCQVSKGSAVRFELNIFCTLVTMATAAILNLFNPNSCHTLRWIFLQSFMKFDERNPKQFLISPFLYLW